MPRNYVPTGRPVGRPPAEVQRSLSPVAKQIISHIGWTPSSINKLFQWNLKPHQLQRLFNGLPMPKSMVDRVTADIELWCRRHNHTLYEEL